MTVSATLIVKDEERLLRRCLDSIRDAVDEIVIVDTGSRDKTKAVARRYTDRLFDFAWRQDFAAARQYAFEKAKGDWVMWVDADDVVIGADCIRPLAASAPAHVGAFYWRYVTDRDTWGNPHCEFWRERCVRNDGTFHWAGRIHEVLVPKRPRAIVRSPEVVVEHHGDRSRSPEKLRRNLEILEAERLASGESPSPRLLFYLGSDYASAGETRKALDAYRQYLRIATWDDERYLGQVRVAELYRVEKRYELAIHADLQALKVCPHWPDAYFGLAKTYYFLQDWAKVVHWTEVGRAMPQPDTLHFVNPMDYRYNWIIYYTNALYHEGALEEAQAWTRRALEICPDDPWHRENWMIFAQALQASREAKEAYQGKGEVVYG
jgi:glycosyltransferase involved in cell wall biosynthesis